MKPQPGAVVSAVARALGEKKEEDATESAPMEVNGSAPSPNGEGSPEQLDLEDEFEDDTE